MHFDKPTYTVRKTRKKDIPKGVYTKDPASGEIIFNTPAMPKRQFILRLSELP